MGEIAGSHDADVGRLLTTYYEGVEMNDTFRLTLQARTRRLVGARTRIPARRWALLAAAGVAGVVVAGLLLRHPATPPTPQPPRVARRPTPAVAPSQQAPSAKGPTGGAAVRSTGTAAAPPAAVTPQPGAAVAKGSQEPLVVVIAARQPAKDETGRALAVGDRLPVGTAVRTGKGARLTLITRLGSEYTLNAGTELVLKSRDTAALRRGEIYCRSRAGEIKLVDTTAGKIHLLGTVIDAATHDSRQVAVTVVSGKVRLSNAHGDAVVRAGKRSVMVASLPPQEGEAVNTIAATAWYDSRGQIISEFGDIAYVVPRSDNTLPDADALTEVWKMKADGSEKQRIKSYIGRAMPPTSWLPGERKLLLWTSSIEWGHPIWKMRRADGMNPIVGDSMTLLDASIAQEMPLQLPAGYVSEDMAVSPDGERLAFGGGYQPNLGDWHTMQGGVWVYDLGSGEIKKVLDGDFWVRVAWAPDSRRLAVSAGWSVHHPIIVIDADTGEVTDLKLKGAGAAFSPQGDRLAYCGIFKPSDAPGAEPSGASVFVLDLAAGAEARHITPAGEMPRQPCWSPDGTRVAYWVLKQERIGTAPRRLNLMGWAVFVARTDGSGVKEIYRREPQENRLSLRTIAWSASGDGVYLSTDSGVLLVAADGSGVKTDLGGSAQDSILSPAESAQTAGAIEAIQEAVFQYSVAHVRAVEGRTAESKAAFQSAADTFAGLPWRYPRAGLSASDVLRYADKAAQMAKGPVKVDDRIRWQIMDDAESVSLSNLRQVALALLIYAADNNETLPQFRDPVTMQEALASYVKTISLFVNPITKRPYAVNAELSGRDLGSFSDPDGVVAFYEDAPALDGTRGVAFLDGHGERVSESQWEALTKESRLP